MCLACNLISSALNTWILEGFMNETRKMAVLSVSNPVVEIFQLDCDSGFCEIIIIICTIGK